MKNKPEEVKKFSCGQPAVLNRHCSGCSDPNSEGTHQGCTIEHGHIGCSFSKSEESGKPCVIETIGDAKKIVDSIKEQIEKNVKHAKDKYLVIPKDAWRDGKGKCEHSNQYICENCEPTHPWYLENTLKGHVICKTDARAGICCDCSNCSGHPVAENTLEVVGAVLCEKHKEYHQDFCSKCVEEKKVIAENTLEGWTLEKRIKFMRKNGIEISPALEKIIIKEVEIAVANKEKEVVKMIEEEIIDISDGVIEAEEPTLADEINRWNAKIEDLASRIRSIKQK